jgi:hypothetical protein
MSCFDMEMKKQMYLYGCMYISYLKTYFFNFLIVSFINLLQIDFFSQKLNKTNLAFKVVCDNKDSKKAYSWEKKG